MRWFFRRGRTHAESLQREADLLEWQHRLSQHQQRSMEHIDNLYQPDDQLPLVTITEVDVQGDDVWVKASCHGIEQVLVQVNGTTQKVVRDVPVSIWARSKHGDNTP